MSSNNSNNDMNIGNENEQKENSVNNVHDIADIVLDYKDYFFTDVRETYQKHYQYLLPLFHKSILDQCFEHILLIAFDITEKIEVIDYMHKRNLLHLPQITQSQIENNENHFRAIKNADNNGLPPPISSMFHFLFEEYDLANSFEKFNFSSEERNLRHQIYLKLSQKYLGPKDYVCRVLQVMSFSLQEIKDTHNYYVDMVTQKWLWTNQSFNLNANPNVNSNNNSICLNFLNQMQFSSADNHALLDDVYFDNDRDKKDEKNEYEFDSDDENDKKINRESEAKSKSQSQSSLQPHTHTNINQVEIQNMNLTKDQNIDLNIKNKYQLSTKYSYSKLRPISYH